MRRRTLSIILLCGVIFMALSGCASTQQLQEVSAVAQRVPSDPHAALLLATKTADTAVHDLHAARVNGAITAAQEKPYLAQVQKAQNWISDGIQAMAMVNGPPKPGSLSAQQLFAKAINLLYSVEIQLQAGGGGTK